MRSSESAELFCAPKPLSTRKRNVSCPGASRTAEKPCTGCLFRYGGRFVPYGLGDVNCPDVGPSENVAAGIVAQPVSVGSAAWAAPTQNKAAAASGRSAAI